MDLTVQNRGGGLSYLLFDKFCWSYEYIKFCFLQSLWGTPIRLLWLKTHYFVLLGPFSLDFIVERWLKWFILVWIHPPRESVLCNFCDPFWRFQTGVIREPLRSLMNFVMNIFYNNLWNEANFLPYRCRTSLIDTIFESSIFHLWFGILVFKSALVKFLRHQGRNIF